MTTDRTDRTGPEEEPGPTAPGHRHIRSFAMRRGRVTRAQRRACEQILPQLAIAYRPARLDLEASFGRRAPTVLEIGFGMGETTAAIALARPDFNFLAVEVFAAGVGALARRADELKLANIRIIQHDAVEVLDHMIADASLDGIHVFFPDPWPKKKHHKRRLIQSAFVAKLATKLKPGGYLHLATDWEDYAGQMLEVLSGETLLANTAKDYSPRPQYRPLTKFEKRGLRLGHGVWDLIFTRKPV